MDELTIPEAVAVLNALNDQHRQEFIEQVTAMHVQVAEISQVIGTMLTEEKNRREMKQLWDYYPGLFEEQREAYMNARLEAERQKRRADDDDRRFWAEFNAKKAVTEGSNGSETGYRTGALPADATKSEGTDQTGSLLQ